MTTIWKYSLESRQNQTINLPTNAEILSIQKQNETITLWARCSGSSKPEFEERHFRIIGTGAEFDDSGLVFIGTVQLGGKEQHVFEVVS